MAVDILALQAAAGLVCLVSLLTVAVKCFNCPTKKKPSVKVDEIPTIRVVRVFVARF